MHPGSASGMRTVSSKSTRASTLRRVRAVLLVLFVGWLAGMYAMKQAGVLPSYAPGVLGAIIGAVVSALMRNWALREMNGRLVRIRLALWMWIVPLAGSSTIGAMSSGSGLQLFNTVLVAWAGWFIAGPVGCVVAFGFPATRASRVE